MRQNPLFSCGSSRQFVSPRRSYRVGSIQFLWRRRQQLSLNPSREPTEGLVRERSTRTGGPQPRTGKGPWGRGPREFVLVIGAALLPCGACARFHCLHVGFFLAPCSAGALPWWAVVAVGVWWLRFFLSPSVGQLELVGVESPCDPSCKEAKKTKWAPTRELDGTRPENWFFFEVALSTPPPSLPPPPSQCRYRMMGRRD